MMRSFGDQSAVAGTLICLGESYLASEDLEETRRAWRAASEILDELDQARADALRERLHRLPATL
jgi:hypothetical protein